MKQLTEKQIQRKLKKIDLLKKELRYEKTKFGGYHDGRGYRYSIAELYFEIGDYRKTNRYLSWFFKIFPTDVTYPHFKIGAASSYHSAKKYQKATDILIDLNNDNTYILHVLTDKPIQKQNKEESYEFNTLEFARQQKESFLEYTNPEFINWLIQLIESDNYQKWYKKYVSILTLITDSDLRPKRSKLLKASYKCLKDWKKDF